MRISWREILGLLVGLAVCYVAFYYALAYAPQIREAAEQTRDEGSQRGETEQRTDLATSNGTTKKVTVRVTGSSGEQFGANFGNLRSSRSVEGVIPADYEVEVHTDPSSGDYVSATAWKTTDDRKELKVQILDGARVLKESSTTKDYGAAGVRWSPSEQPPGGGTTGGETTAPAR